MILAEKIMNLRKKAGWSQEELADQLGISRQSVSKWESGASIPDLDKIIKMSNLFGVSTDYLLKEELEEISFAESIVEEEEVRSISAEDANAFINDSKDFAKWMAPSVTAIILAVIPLVILGGMADILHIMNEDVAGGIGVAILLTVIAISVGIMIVKGLQYDKYDYLEKEAFTLQYGVRGIVEKRKENYAPTFRAGIAVGVVIIILGVIPVVITGALNMNEMVVLSCVGFLLFLIAWATFLFVRCGIMYDSFNKLLQEDDYAASEKAFNRKYEAFPGIYWCIITTIFLACGFGTEDWGKCALIWPVAGVLFAAIMGILRAVNTNKRDGI